MNTTGFKKELLIFMAVLAAGLAALGAARYFFVRMEALRYGMETRGDLGAPACSESEIIHEGQRYVENERLLNILVMGTDQDEEEAESGSLFRHGGQADFLMVISVNEDTQTVTCLAIDRDTMTEIRILGMMGNETGTRCEQICLSYGFGDGREKSCELCVEAVENLLLGIHIDYYAALNMDGIPALNDALGGVTVKIEDDFTALDPDMCIGATIKLNGGQAKYFVRERLSIRDSTNKARMIRQREYLKNAFELMAQQAEEDPDSAKRIYDAVKDYLITDMSGAKIIGELDKADEYNGGQTLYLEGRHTIGDDGFVEFHADEDSLKQMAVDVFFRRTTNKGN